MDILLAGRGGWWNCKQIPVGISLQGYCCTDTPTPDTKDLHLLHRYLVPLSSVYTSCLSIGRYTKLVILPLETEAAKSPDESSATDVIPVNWLLSPKIITGERESKDAALGGRVIRERRNVRELGWCEGIIASTAGWHWGYVVDCLSWTSEPVLAVTICSQGDEGKRLTALILCRSHFVQDTYDSTTTGFTPPPFSTIVAVVWAEIHGGADGLVCLRVLGLRFSGRVVGW